MKKYKLIKEYPGYSNLGKIVEICSTDETGYYSENTEYWEEVIEKDYEILIAKVVPYTILSVKRLSDGEVFTVDDLIKTPYSDNTRIKGFQNPEGNEYFIEIPTGFTRLSTIEKVIEKDYEILSYLKKDRPSCITTKKRGGERHEEFWGIHSVKRLSDGEVFTIGDRVKIGENCDSTKKIDEIKLTDDSSAFVNGIWLYYEKGCSHFKHATKVKQPIFLTHDGRDIFVGDRIVWVNKDSLLHGTFTADYGSLFCSNQHAYFISAVEAEDYIEKNKVLFITEDGVGIKKDEVVYVVDGRLNSIDMISNFVPKDYPTFKAFSNSKAAENYIQKNKACLSYNDVVEAICLNGCGKDSLQELVNKKLGIK